jgi:hypothetical protein
MTFLQVNKTARGVVEHPQSYTLKLIMQHKIVIQNLQKAITDGNLDQIPDEGKVWEF